ncbi:hypothetical protein F0P96_13035 [Hymenobacter busanensis]|uniref:Uncharacterized protein n=1 Tax=Hymenobacter busanensis TaxID=2607656 RepID=A0A7L4ZVM7_9BACT|nr:hypothetical protein [Hymenobacter busanensis]KAA9332392.1 hypothetical protein F0P96_13035 [Hymenobacter busanensis]QHJ07271.1 hypothetical protein GUY19_08240 [Hymenobacter busanensis]
MHAAGSDWVTLAAHTINRVGAYGVVVPLLIGVVRWRHLSPAGRALVWYFAFWTVEAPINFWSRRVLHTNLYLHHLDVLAETWLLAWAYYRALPAASRMRPMLLPAMGLFTALCLADATVLSGLQAPNQYARLGQTLLMLSLIIGYFDAYMRQPPTQDPWRETMFVASVGLGIYFAGSITGYLLQAASSSLLLTHAAGLVIDSMYLICLLLMTLAVYRDQARRGLEQGRPVVGLQEPERQVVRVRVG